MDLKPCYEFGELNESVLLASNEPCTFRYNHGETNGQANLKLEFLPRPRVKIDVKCKASDMEELLSACPDVSRLSVNGREFLVIPANLTLSSSSPSGNITFTPKSEPVHWVGDEKTKVSKVVFHLFNYKGTLGTHRFFKRSGDMLIISTKTKLESAEWLVELQNCETMDTIKKLRKTGGYGLTHMGCFYRVDGAPFDAEVAKKMLEHLHYFFTFSKGTFCSPVLPVGFNENRQRVWELLNTPFEPWSTPLSWFDQRHCEQLVNLFPGIIEKLEDKDWTDTIRKALYWYAQSNDGSGSGVETGIILTQVAIERLAFEYIVNFKKMIEAEDFKNKRASDRFRLLFDSLGIPIDIPNNLLGMCQVTKKLQFEDAPHALTDIRNSLVHPDHRHEGEFMDIYFDARSLGLWYLELSILRICNYSSTYFNRLSNDLRIGIVEDVPCNV